jgi:hypothetical protein
MKCVITGHTSGIGKTLYEHYTALGWTVVGLSRSNGYNIKENFKKVVDAVQGCDLFINNAYRDQQQLELLIALKRSVKKIVVCGSVSRLYPDLIKTDYVEDKLDLSEYCRMMSLSDDPTLATVLHLDLSFIESTPVDLSDPNSFTSDYFITYSQITSAIDFWLSNTSIRQIEFTWKLTPFVYEQLQRANTNTAPLNKLLEQVKSI